ncbi:MAG TPA: ATP-binding protein [Cyclobacteriaceae bacterium]|jgi:signal transduction histidine kinase|nr:ATP-binding protein [Cyclobacteriaceae bacterium]
MLRKLFPFIAAVLLLIIAITWNNSGRESFSDKSLANRVSQNLEKELLSLEKEASVISLDSLHFNWSVLKHSFYLIENGKITAWSKNDFSISIADLDGNYKLKLLQTPRMDLLLYPFPKGQRSLVGVIPLRVGYEIVNSYLTTTWNKKIFPVQGMKISSVNDSSGVAVCLANHGCLFKTKVPDGTFVPNKVSLGIVMISVLLTLLGAFIIVRDLHSRKNYLLAFIVLFGSMAAIRIAMVQFLLPGRWIYSEFFDPKYFASSSFNASVGDFFLNALIVTISCAYLFKVYSKLHFIKNSSRKSNFIKISISILLLLASYFAFLFPHLFVESIFHDSAISIDITSGVAFDGLRVVAFGALFLGCISSFLFVHVLVRWVKLLLKSKLQFVFTILLASLLFASYFLFSDLNYWTSFFVGAIYFSVLYFTSYFRSLSHIGSRIFSFLLIALIAYGTQAALGIWRFAEEKEVRSMLRSASNLISRDVLGEYLLNESTNKIASDKFIISNMASPLLTKDVVRQKVRQIHLGSYFDRYEVKVKLYHTDGSPADNGLDDFATSIKAFQNEANRTIYEGVYFIHSEAPETIKRYLAVVPLIRNNISLGYVVLDLSLKQIVPQQVYPELLVDSRFVQTFRNRNYSYSFFNKDKLMGSMGSFNFDRDFDISQLKYSVLYSKGIKSNGYWFVGAEDETGRQAVVSSEGYQNFFILANFSFLFIVGIGLIFLLLIAYLISQARQKITLNYATRIQLYVYLSFIVPLVVVSTIALRMIRQSDESQLEKEIRDKGIQITESISDILDKNDTSSIQELQTKVEEISQASSVDANVYAPSGRLLASSQPTIFNSQLVMPLPNREAWGKITNEKFNIVKARCNIGSLEYNSLFFAIKTGKNRVDGILELPFLKSNSDTVRVSVLNNILVTFVIVFIAFSFFAFNAIDKLTFPLRFIAKKLKTTSLGENQPIEWKANDEIGQMVKEYNRMLDNLEQNKIDLARNQKESAWREIAQQVAHEIKNPLTPMKLTLQQMEQSVANNPLDQERTKKSIQTMLTQVDVLNGIAGSFSAFAKMPAPVLERVDVILLLARTVALFENETNTIIEFNQPQSSVFSRGDAQLLGRIFSNIILNALQSGANGKKIRLEIIATEEKDWSTVSFRDNGLGIAEELRDKIFLPNFTTKNTGSGLGLAIAKQGIEQMGGTIWFETTSGLGTTFFVKLKTYQV